MIVLATKLLIRTDVVFPLSSFRLIIECMSMASEAASAAQRLTVTDPTTYPSDEKRRTNSIRRRHRRPQKFFTTQRLPAFFAWLILLTTSSAYWICILPEILVLLPHLLPLPIIHCVLFVLVCANFYLATFMDPVIIEFFSFFNSIGIFVVAREFMPNQGEVNPLMPLLILVLQKIVMMTMMMILNLVLFAFEMVHVHHFSFHRDNQCFHSSRFRVFEVLSYMSIISTTTLFALFPLWTMYWCKFYFVFSPTFNTSVSIDYSRLLIIIVHGWIIVLVGCIESKLFIHFFFFYGKLGRRNYRYFFQFLFLLCIHMIFLFAFCLYYVLHDRHHRIITPNYPSLPLNNHLPTNQIDYASIYVNKSQFIGFSDYRFILCIVLLILLGLFAIPIGGLTGFHIYLISQGRTTNEQVTGKYRIQNDLFNQGCWKNCCFALCQPLYPRLKAPKVKRYDVETFEQMAYGKYRDGKQTNNHQQNGQMTKIPNIQINPVDGLGEKKWKRRRLFLDWTNNRVFLVRQSNHQNSSRLGQQQQQQQQVKFICSAMTVSNFSSLSRRIPLPHLPLSHPHQLFLLATNLYSIRRINLPSNLFVIVYPIFLFRLVVPTIMCKKPAMIFVRRCHTILQRIMPNKSSGFLSINRTIFRRIVRWLYVRIPIDKRILFNRLLSIIPNDHS